MEKKLEKVLDFPHIDSSPMLEFIFEIAMF